MAIKCKFTTMTGIELPEAYVNISNPQIVKEKTEGENQYSLSANVHFYANQQAYLDNKPPCEGKGISFDLNLDANPLGQAYTYLKAQEYIIDANDC